MIEKNDTGRDFIFQHQESEGLVKASGKVCLQKGIGRNMQKITNNR